MPTAQWKIRPTEDQIPYAKEAVVDSTPGAIQTLINETVPAGKTVYITNARMVSRAEGKWTLYKGAQIIASGRTGPGQVTDDQWWTHPEGIVEGINIKLMFTQVANQPILPVEAYINGYSI